jgi:hypothetical protein
LGNTNIFFEKVLKSLRDMGHGEWVIGNRELGILNYKLYPLFPTPLATTEGTSATQWLLYPLYPLYLIPIPNN